ncbi:MAG: hypothetical protein EBT92_09030 [Planctomycetes bacterium]|nr:hypothetical protein [Planctomycetota bacterium]NBY01484.1 hypothetical protein [Planctomycetota bacterium]
MTDPFDKNVNRRKFLGTSGVLATSVAIASEKEDLILPKVKEPRATSGDIAVDPDWNEKLTFDVGVKKGAIVGNDDKAIQAAVDYLSRFGGGTVRLSEGTYHLRNAIHLNNHVRIVGSGPDTVLFKSPMVKTKILVDSDWYDQEITLVDSSGFKVGDGVCLRCKNPHNGGNTVIKRTLVAKSGNRFKLDKALRENLWLMSDSYAATLFPLVTGEFIHGFAIENLTIDGNRGNNENLDGNHAGCIFLQDCRDVKIRKVIARNNNGDGISWQICHDVSVEQCQSHHHAGLGMHPGSGSQRPLMKSNVLTNNDIGIFFCWGVKYGLASDNIIEGNRIGISVGHRDTDNVIIGNHVRESGKSGILFRAERGKAFAGHNNLLEKNIIENTGGPDSIAIDVEGETEGLKFVENKLVEKRGSEKRVGFRFGPKTGQMILTSNTMEGFATPILDQRKKN